MLPDPFALLALPRRPWLEPGVIKESYHLLGRELHPDAPGGAGDSDRFAALNEAQATLSDPRRRLSGLLALEFADAPSSAPAPVPADLGELVFPTQGFLQTVDRFLVRKAAASGALARAVLAREEWTLREEAETRLMGLDARLNQALEDLRRFDAEAWDARPPDAAAILRGLRDRLSYLTRWTEQFRERLFQLGL